ncbi:MAG: RecX family transcriptional regulator [Paludibacteraceae bacterium]|nr:RecX family transcriptional regulator [Paludibacteraceae bacterium]
MANNDLSTQPIAVDTDALLDRGQRYCATAERCPADVEQLFCRLGATREQTDEVIGILQQQDFINPARYCTAFVHDKVAFQGWGRMKVLAGLRAKRLPEQSIQDALHNIDETVYAANIRKLIRSKRGQDRQKVMRFMLQRGYTFDDLRRYADYETDD